MKKSLIAAIVLSLSAPLAMAHSGHDQEGDAAVVKPQSARKAGGAKSAQEAEKAKEAATEAEKADEKAPSAPKSK